MTETAKIDGYRAHIQGVISRIPEFCSDRTPRCIGQLNKQVGGELGISETTVKLTWTDDAQNACAIATGVRDHRGPPRP